MTPSSTLGRTRPLLAAAAAVLALSGCSGDSDPEASGGSAPASAGASAAPSDASAEPSDDPSADASADPSGAPAEDGPVLAARTGSVGGQPAELQVVSLRRSGTLASLDLRLTNTGTDSAGLPTGPFGSTSIVDRTLSGVSLVDGVNRKRYVPVRDSEDRCLCSRTPLNLFGGESIVLSATFAAPPADVETVTVEVPLFGTFDVPVAG